MIVSESSKIFAITQIKIHQKKIVENSQHPVTPPRLTLIQPFFL